MAIQTTTFKGARYIVKFHDPIEWASTESYEAIEAVQHEAFTYISKQPVPAGVQIGNTDFWLLWADPNAQMEELRQLVSSYVDDVEELSGAVGDLSTNLGLIDNALPISEFSAENTVKDYIDSQIATVETPKIQNTKIRRYGRFVSSDNTAPIPNQACTFNDHLYYLTDNGMIATYDEQGHEVQRNTPNIGHGNGIAVNTTNILVADGYAPKMYLLDKQNLSVLHTIDLSGENFYNVNSCAEYNDDFYFVGYYVTSTDVARLFKLNITDYSFVEVCNFSAPTVGAKQNMCMLGGYLYLSYTAPNMILKVDIETGEIIKIYQIENGDGLFPIGELESPFVKDNDIKLFGVWRHTGNIFASIITAKDSLGMVFDCNILHDVESGYQEEEFTFGGHVLRLENIPYTFNPRTLSQATGIEISAIANYWKYALIYLIGTGFTGLTLNNGIYNIVGSSGDRVIDFIHSENSQLTTHTVHPSIILLDGTIADFETINSPTNCGVYIWRSKVSMRNFDMQNVSIFQITKTKIELDVIKNYNADLFSSAADNNYVGNSISVKSFYSPGIVRILKCGGNVGSIEIVGDDTFVKTRIGQSRIADTGDWQAPVFGDRQNTAITHLRFKANGKIYYYDGTNETEVEAYDMLTLTCYRG